MTEGTISEHESKSIEFTQQQRENRHKNEKNLRPGGQ